MKPHSLLAFLALGTVMVTIAAPGAAADDPNLATVKCEVGYGTPGPVPADGHCDIHGECRRDSRERVLLAS